MPHHLLLRVLQFHALYWPGLAWIGLHMVLYVLSHLGEQTHVWQALHSTGEEILRDAEISPTHIIADREGVGLQGFVVMDNPHDRVKVTFQKELLEVHIPIGPACCSSSSNGYNAGNAHGRCIS